MNKRIRAKYGTIRGRRFLREVNRSKHYFWSKGGYAFGDYIKTLKGVDEIWIIEKDTGKILKISYKKFLNKMELITKPYRQYFIGSEYLKEVE